jgi:hypothetical protein
VNHGDQRWLVPDRFGTDLAALDRGFTHVARRPRFGPQTGGKVAVGRSRALAFEAAYTIRQIEDGRASLLRFLSGGTGGVFGVSLLQSTRSSGWMGGSGLLEGLGPAAIGTAEASTGFSEAAMALNRLTSSVLML